MRRWAASLLLALGGFHVFLTATLVAHYGLRHPFLDQFRLYERYLTHGLWDGVAALENGHRPLLPGLVRWLDLFWQGGHGLLLTASAWGAAALALALLLRPVWRELDTPLAAAASVMLVVTLLWGAHARMFIHAFEAQHLWYILLGVVAGARAAIGAGASAARWSLALGCCVLATFSFGPGLASFAALLVLVLLQRAGWRLAGLVLLVAVVSAAAYLWWLPGADAVRGQSQGLNLLAALRAVGARWGAWWVEFLPWDGAPDMALRRGLAFTLGTLAVGLVVVSAAWRWWRREHFSVTELLGLALLVFAVTANTLIAANRVAYFELHPGQLFAERYLFWTGVLWAGVGLYGLARVAAHGSPRVAGATLLGVALVAALAVPPALRWRAWSAEVYRRVEVSALAHLMDVRSPELLAEITDGPLDNAWRCAAAMRAAGVGVFAAGVPPTALGGVADGAADAEVPVFSVTWRPVAAPGAPAWLVQRVLPAEWASQVGERNWLVDDAGQVVGAAGLTFHGASGTEPWHGVREPLDGLQGLVRSARPATLWLVAERQGRHQVLLRLRPDT